MSGWKLSGAGNIHSGCPSMRVLFFRRATKFGDLGAYFKNSARNFENYITIDSYARAYYDDLEEFEDFKYDNAFFTVEWATKVRGLAFNLHRGMSYYRNNKKESK